MRRLLWTTLSLATPLLGWNNLCQGMLPPVTVSGVPRPGPVDGSGPPMPAPVASWGPPPAPVYSSGMPNMYPPYPVSGMPANAAGAPVPPPYSSARQLIHADLSRVVESNNQFALDLYAALRQGKGNLFFSPYSVSTALA